MFLYAKILILQKLPRCQVLSKIKNLINQFNFKDLIYFAVICVVGVFAWINSRDNQSNLDNLNIAYKQLSDTVARANSEVVTKSELKEFAKSLGSSFSEINADLSSLGANLKAVGITTVEIKGKFETHVPSTVTPGIIIDHIAPPQPAKCSLCDIHDYTIQIQAVDITFGTMPFANIQFDASLDKPWTIKIDDIDFKIDTVVGEKTNGVLVFYHTVSMYNASRPELKNKEVQLKIVKSEYKEVLPGKSFYWFAPAIDLNLINTLSIPGFTYHVGGYLGLSLMGYGQSKLDLDWRFIEAGIGITQDSFIVILSPAKYNIARQIPLLTNLWLSLDAVWFGNSNTYGAGLSLGTRL